MARRLRHVKAIQIGINLWSFYRFFREFFIFLIQQLRRFLSGRSKLVCAQIYATLEMLNTAHWSKSRSRSSSENREVCALKSSPPHAVLTSRHKDKQKPNPWRGRYTSAAHSSWTSTYNVDFDEVVAQWGSVITVLRDPLLHPLDVVPAPLCHVCGTRRKLHKSTQNIDKTCFVWRWSPLLDSLMLPCCCHVRCSSHFVSLLLGLWLLESFRIMPFQVSNPKHLHAEAIKLITYCAAW